jgi:hypothetical protein
MGIIVFRFYSSVTKGYDMTIDLTTLSLPTIGFRKITVEIAGQTKAIKPEAYTNIQPDDPATFADIITILRMAFPDTEMIIWVEFGNTIRTYKVRQQDDKSWVNTDSVRKVEPIPHKLPPISDNVGRYSVGCFI